MSWRSHRRGAATGRSLAEGLDVPNPFDLGELCRRVGSTRGRPIEFAAMPLAATGPCGLWLATDSIDLICYEQFTSPLHQHHIVLHELGHILADHRQPERLGTLLAGLVPQLSHDTLKIMMARQHDSYLAEQEKEAELFAYTVLRRIARHSGRGIGEDGWASRFGRMLED